MTKMKTLFAGLAAISALGGAAFVTVSSAPAAMAQSGSAKAVVDKAIQDGVLGETVAGYIEEVPGATVSGAVRAAMNEINIGRKTVYTRLAREQNVSVEVVAALTGEKQIAKQRGGKVRTETGWKPAG